MIEDGKNRNVNSKDQCETQYVNLISTSDPVNFRHSFISLSFALFLFSSSPLYYYPPPHHPPTS